MQFPVRSRSRSPRAADPAVQSAAASSAGPWVQAAPGHAVVDFRGASVLGLPGLRSDAPGRKARTKGAAPELSTEAAQNLALAKLETDFYAASTSKSVKSRRACVAELLRSWGLPTFPVTPDSLWKLGASIKAGGYRSAASLLSQYRVDAERRGCTFDAQLSRLYADISRSCRRGLGPPVRAGALPMERLRELSGDHAPFVREGPLGPRNALVVGSYWLLREAELSSLRAAMVTITPGPVPTAVLVLPASKNDVEAQGVSRAHACLCGSGSPMPDCPVHAAWDQLWLLKRAFPQRFVG